ncbi:MAG TPA: DUF2207 domain-containing protein [Bacilli bacterium]|nr:DUF2207 domain-containing protein [Bacilli bacterium]
MKKILILLSCFLFIPVVKAVEVDYKITNYFANYQIQANGDVFVKEAFVINGSLNGYERDLLYKNSLLSNYQPGKIDFANSAIYNATNIYDIKASAYILNTAANFDLLQKDITYLLPTKQNNNAYYTIADITDGYRLRTYSAMNNQTQVFYYEYYIDNVVVIHNDVAEFYYNIVGQNLDDDIANVEIRVLLPQSDQSNYFRIWAFGPLNGTATFIDKIGFRAQISPLAMNTPLSLRTTFALGLITDQKTLRRSEQNAFKAIIAYGDEQAALANEERARIKEIFYGIEYSALGYTILLIMSFIVIRQRYDKEYPNSFKAKYNRQFIEDYNVEVIDYLMNKRITPNALSASIMNLIYKKNITVKELPKKNYEFTYQNDNQTNDTEKYLIDFLFNKVGNKEQFTLSGLKAYGKSKVTYNEFTTSYSNWRHKVVVEAKAQGFFEGMLKVKVYAFIMAFVGLFIWLAAIANITGFAYAKLLIILVVPFIIYTIVFTKRTPKGNDHYQKWLAFKRFLNDFGLFDTKELPEIILWERYLVYAVIFGLAGKVQKVMNTRFNEINENTAQTDFMPIYYLHMSNALSSSVNTAVHQAISAANANSVQTTSGGFGGGFSGGGGFGGGGGGGRGF